MASISTLPIPARFPDPFTTDPHIPERVIGERRSYRAVWVSDIHLGTRGCNAAMLIDFFDHVDFFKCFHPRLNLPRLGSLSLKPFDESFSLPDLLLLIFKRILLDLLPECFFF